MISLSILYNTRLFAVNNFCSFCVKIVTTVIKCVFSERRKTNITAAGDITYRQIKITLQSKISLAFLTSIDSANFYLPSHFPQRGKQDYLFCLRLFFKNKRKKTFLIFYFANSIFSCFPLWGRLSR